MCKYYVYRDSTRIIAKKINLRIEHVKHSNCRLDFLNRMKENEQRKRQAKEQGIRVICKRQVSASPPSGYKLMSCFTDARHQSLVHC